MPSHKPYVYIRLQLHEKQAIQAKAAQLRLSTSEFMRRVSLGMPLPEFGKAQVILDLLKINADLARLGNLQRLLLDNVTENNLPISTSKINENMALIKITQNLLKDKIQEL